MSTLLYLADKKSFNPVLDPDADPDQHRNLTISKVGPNLTFPEICRQIRL